VSAVRYELGFYILEDGILLVLEVYLQTQSRNLMDKGCIRHLVIIHERCYPET
jgi:hypothetical protein